MNSSEKIQENHLGTNSINAFNLKNIVIFGLPNSGKSSIFNKLTKEHQKAANYIGVTVAENTGILSIVSTFKDADLIIKTNHQTYKEIESSCKIIDLPGSYDLAPNSIDETIALDGLIMADIVLFVIDCTRILNSTRLLFEIKDHLKKINKQNTPIIVALNMYDLIGYQYDENIIDKQTKTNLAVSIQQAVNAFSVVNTIANKSYGIERLATKIIELVAHINHQQTRDYKNNNLASITHVLDEKTENTKDTTNIYARQNADNETKLNYLQKNQNNQNELLDEFSDCNLQVQDQQGSQTPLSIHNNQLKQYFKQARKTIEIKPNNTSSNEKNNQNNKLTRINSPTDNYNRDNNSACCATPCYSQSNNINRYLTINNNHNNQDNLIHSNHRNNYKSKLDKLNAISRKLDIILLHPILGSLIFLLILFFVFQSVFDLAKIPQEMIKWSFDQISEYLAYMIPKSTLLYNMINDGVLAGIGAVIAFLPQIIIIMVFIFIFEDSGYMSRIVCLTSRFMGTMGFDPKTFMPLLSSVACAIPGIFATRVIANQRHRLIAILISPLMTCSARVPVYVLLISAFIPNEYIFYGTLNLQGLMLFALYLIGTISALLVGMIMHKFFFKQLDPSCCSSRKNFFSQYSDNIKDNIKKMVTEKNGTDKKAPNIFLIELPNYQIPNFRQMFIYLIDTIKSFVHNAGTIIFFMMIIIWALCYFPSPLHVNYTLISDNYSAPIGYSIAGSIAKFFEILFLPIGFSYLIIIALIAGMMAREIVISVIALTFSIQHLTHDNLVATISDNWSLATGVSLIVWYIFAPQCIATLAVAKSETGAWRFPIIMFIYQICLAYVMCLFVYQCFNLLH